MMNLRNLAPLLLSFLLAQCGAQAERKSNSRNDDKAEPTLPVVNPSPSPSPSPAVEKAPSIVGKWHLQTCYFVPTGGFSFEYVSFSYLFRENGTGTFYINKYYDEFCTRPFPESNPTNKSSSIEYSVGKKIGVDIWELDISYVDTKKYIAFAIRDGELHKSDFCDADSVRQNICPQIGGASADNRSTFLVDRFSTKPIATP